jgi:hypothetical protein
MKVQSQGGNKYTFDFGGGAETIMADGTDQPGLDRTLLSAKQEAQDTWIIERKKDGRLTIRATWKLSGDGGTLTDYYREFDSDGSTTSLDYVYQRVGGGSGFAGDWQSIRETRNSPLSMEVKAYEGDGLSFITPSQHRTQNVRFDGKDYSPDGSKAGQGTAISAQRVDEHNLVIIHKYNEKFAGKEDVGLSADTKTMTITAATSPMSWFTSGSRRFLGGGAKTGFGHFYFDSRNRRQRVVHQAGPNRAQQPAAAFVVAVACVDPHAKCADPSRFGGLRQDLDRKAGRRHSAAPQIFKRMLAGAGAERSHEQFGGRDSGIVAARGNRLIADNEVCADAGFEFRAFYVTCLAVHAAGGSTATAKAATIVLRSVYHACIHPEIPCPGGCESARMD